MAMAILATVIAARIDGRINRLHVASHVVDYHWVALALGVAVAVTATATATATSVTVTAAIRFVSMHHAHCVGLG